MRKPGTQGRTDRASLEVAAQPDGQRGQDVRAHRRDDRALPRAFAGEMIMTWPFEPTPAGAKVTVIAENVPPGIGQADHDAGLRSSLENLANYLLGR